MKTLKEAIWIFDLLHLSIMIPMHVSSECSSLDLLFIY